MKGEFEIRNLTPGPYNAVAEIAIAGRGYAGWTGVDVAGSEIDGVVITIGGGLSLTGRVHVEGESKAALRNLQIHAVREDASAVVDGPGRTARTGEDGEFEIENLPAGRYRIDVRGLPDGFYMKGVRSGDTDVTYSGLDLTPGVPGQVGIVLSPKAAVISGAVRTRDGSAPAPGSTVVSVPKDKDRARIGAYYRQTTSDQHGRFTLSNVAPGEYDLYSWEDVEPTAWMDPEFMKPHAGKGHSVKVGESSHESVQATVISAEPAN